MNECNFIETTNTRSNLSSETKFRLDEINEIKDYFNSEIQERNMSKNLSKYIAAFDYFDKALIVLSTTSGRRISIISFESVISVPVGIASASFTLVFSLTTGIIKKLLKKTQSKKKKHNKIAMLAKSKLNSIETLISWALIDLEIIHELFKTIVNEKKSMKKWKTVYFFNKYNMVEN